ncbi:type II toxin-antitoxin system toxin DNA ADP-ribosyl transferase DarT [Halopseudomonas pelagia]|uniref:type II toxin-antitoxin system toxin DNA ADP-ribosyl transferase DarT n=1 Tax=Halopseudomonas pelagia TaxID=553151 RepID=UPI0030DA6123|tara:strand:- start:2285 stop:2929 length:645 start_codon:yes stop_codon:yes gene_type:complete
MNYKNLNPDKALIWRITHRRNMPWILANGLHAVNSQARSSDWVTIGNQELIDRRGTRSVPLAPGGMLNDFVPFYFTPFSPMLLNIHTGRGGVAQVPNADIVILVSSLYRVAELSLPFVFTDRHAYTQTANYYNDLAGLRFIDWPLLQQRNFKRDPDDPEKVERYQAEALIYRQAPIQALLGVVCNTPQVKSELEEQVARTGVQLDVYCRPQWYF